MVTPAMLETEYYVQTTPADDAGLETIAPP